MRKADLIAFLQNNKHHVQSTGEAQAQRPTLPPLQMSPSRALLRDATWEPQTEARQSELEAPLAKRQLKHRQNRDSKLAKKFKNLEKENDNLKSQMKASESTNARFKKKKIRSMKREADKIAEKQRESVQTLKLLEPRVPKDPTLKPHPPNRNKCIEAKIDELNKKIRRAKKQEEQRMSNS